MGEIVECVFENEEDSDLTHHCTPVGEWNLPG